MNRKELLDLKPEKRISHFQFNLKAILGKGSFGTVYAGRNIINQDIVALKVIDNQKLQGAERESYALSKEIQIMKKLNHPNIVKLYEVYFTTKNSYLITEYCNGPDLRQFLQEKNTLSENEAKTMIKQIANGLKEIVNNSFIHRDLKPANILLHDGQCKITDFGFSRQLAQDTVMESLVGTPLYMAPQILIKSQYTSKCDVWSLGLIFYEMLFGTLPWMAQNYLELIWKLQNQQLSFPKNIKISNEAQNFIIGCLQKDEVKRFSWNEVFLHPIIKPKLQIKQEAKIIKEIFSPSYATYRQATQIKAQLPGLRERSCSGKQLKPDIPSASSQQSTECEENQNQKLFYFIPKVPNEKTRRTKSQLEYIKNNQTDLAVKKQLLIQQPLPSNPSLIKQNFMSKKPSLIDNFQKQQPVKVKVKTKPSIDTFPLLLDLILSLEKDKEIFPNKEFETFLRKERKNLFSQDIESKIKIAQGFIKIAPEQIKKKLENLIQYLKKDSTKQIY